MYAIIDIGGKQYRVEEGKKVKVDLLEKNVGDTVTFKSVLYAAGDGSVETPSDKKVEGKVIGTVMTKKVDVFKKRPKKGYKKMIGHRQSYTEVEIIKIG
jgi:large subunit ribosomal protein L21